MFSKKWGQMYLVIFSICIAVITGFFVVVEPKLMLIFILPIAFFFIIRAGLRKARVITGMSDLWVGLLVTTLWLLMINVPTFMSFDATGFTRDHGLFNAQSFSRMALFLWGGLALLIFWAKWSRDSITKNHSLIVPGFWLICAFYGWFIMTAPFVSEGGIYSALSVYRVLEWGVFIILLIMVMVIQNTQRKSDFHSRVSIILPVLWFLFFSNIFFFLISPSSVYQVSAITGEARFGALFTHPNLLAMISVVLIAYSLAFMKGWKQVLTLLLVFTVLFFTYSRGGYAELLVVLVLFVIFNVKHAFIKLIIFISLFLFLGIYLFMMGGQAEVLSFLARGHNTASLTSLSERDAVWSAAKIMIFEAPLLGEGFISGPKKIGDMMILSGLSGNFAAPHAHNELLQVQLSGGVIASLLLVSIYARIVYLLLKIKQFDNKQMFFLWSILVCTLILGILKPVLSHQLSLPGILVLWLYFVLEYQYKKESKILG